MPEQTQTQSNEQSSNNQFKRHVAFKLRIGDVLAGNPITVNGGKFSHLDLNSKKIVRVNVIGNIVDRFENSPQPDGSGSKYLFLKLDDGSGQIQLKTFGDDMEKFKEISQGLTVIVIGTLRHWNNETYIQPEIIKEADPKYLLVRKLELEKNRSKTFSPQSTTSQETKNLSSGIKTRIIDLIKNSEPEGGIETDKIITELRDASPEVIKAEIQKLLENGMIFEPRPGKLRWLG